MEIVFQHDMRRAFNLAECCTSVYDRHSYYVARSFQKVVRRGVSSARHMSVGRFRARDIQKGVTRQTPCYIPWTFIEPERRKADVLQNLDDARQTLEVFRAEGWDTSRMHLRFSGNKSFWICIPASLMGHPLGTVQDQIALRERVFKPLMPCRVDDDLWDGRHLHRMLGSVHEKGGPVVTLPFEALDSPSALDKYLPHGMGVKTPVPFEGPDEVLFQRCQEKTQFHVPLCEDVRREELKGYGFMQDTEDGVSQGDRNTVAFKRACVLLRRDDSTAWEELKKWNRKCDPPLNEHELEQCLRSAQRTISRAA